MAQYRIPVWRQSVDINGRRYVASGDGTFVPDTAADAAEMAKLGGVLDEGVGSVPEWVIDGSGTLVGMRKPDGTIRYVDAWEDLTFPASGINPPGAAGSATRDTSTGMLVFSGSADNFIAGTCQMRHACKEGSTIRPHVHLRFPTASAGVNTRWKFEYDKASINGNFANAYGSYTTLATITVANPNNALKHVIASFGDLAMTGHTISTCMMWRVSRLAGTDSDDNDTSDVVLTDFDIHFQIDSDGSRLETSK